MARTLSGNGRGRGKKREPTIGDNSRHVDRHVIVSFVEQVSRLEDHVKEINEAKKDIYADARDAGIVTKELRKRVREYRMTPEARQSMFEIEDQYRAALGMLAGTPLGDAAVSREEAARD